MNQQVVSAVQKQGILERIKKFFDPKEPWGSLNRRQLVFGLGAFICAFVFNALNGAEPLTGSHFVHSTQGLMWTTYFSLFILAVTWIFKFSLNPWYERILPLLITSTGLLIVVALNNFSAHVDNVGVIVYAVFGLIAIMITAGFFIEKAHRHDHVLRLWFTILGYLFSVILAFYLSEKYIKLIY